MGGIDEAALDRLSLVTQMTKHIRVRASGGKTTPSELGQFSPIFVWLLRVISSENIILTTYCLRTRVHDFRTCCLLGNRPFEWFCDDYVPLCLSIFRTSIWT